MPFLGGAAIVAGFAVAVLGVSLVAPFPGGRGELAVILATAVGLSLVGLVDDLRHLGPLPRVVAELVAGVVVWQSGVGVELYGPWQVDFVVTVAWVVLVTNAFNLLDNMDGLSAGVAAVSAGSFFILAATNGQLLVATLAIAVAGCALGFLRHNFHPARIYMGDAGSLFLGFLLAVVGIKLRSLDTARSVALFVPPVVLAIALFDTLLVTFARLAHRRNPLSGGRDHVSHRLVFLGLPVHVAVGVIYAGAFVAGWLALVLTHSSPTPGLLIVGLLAAVGVALGLALGAVPVYERSDRRHQMLAAVEGHELNPPGSEAAEPDDSGVIRLRDTSDTPTNRLRGTGEEAP